MRAFELARASDAAAALSLMRQRAESGGGDAAADRTCYLAGGTTLLDLMKLDVMAPTAIIDIRAAENEYGRIEADPAGLHLGALARMADAAEHDIVRRDYPAVAESLQQAASAQLRNMATLGGNVLQRTRCGYFRDTGVPNCNKRNPGSGCAAIDGVNRLLAVLGTSEHCIASYPGDFAVVLAALGASVELRDPGGSRRSIPFTELHRLPGATPHLETTLQPGEMITGFLVPAGPWTRRSRYVKVRDRTSYAFAVASAAVALFIDSSGKVVQARVGLGGVATVPWRSHAAEAVLQGTVLTEAVAAEAARVAFADAVTHGENAWKPELGRRTLVRALLEVAGC